jgi:D-alanyl-D-alanine carboxypeptidase
MRKTRVGGATCGPMWGHDGDFPGYRTDTYSTRDGRRQVVVLVNEIRDMLPPAARRALDAVIATAFCG